MITPSRYKGSCITAKETSNKTTVFTNSLNKKGIAKFCTTLIFRSSSGSRNKTANACTPTIGIKESYQSVRELPARNHSQKKLSKMYEMPTNYAGMSVVDNQAPSGLLSVLVKAIGRRQWPWDWSMNEALQVHLVFKEASTMVSNNDRRKLYRIVHSHYL